LVDFEQAKKDKEEEKKLLDEKIKRKYKE